MASGPSLLSSNRGHEIRNTCNMAIPEKRVEIALDEETGEDETSAEKEHHEMEMKAGETPNFMPKATPEDPFRANLDTALARQPRANKAMEAA